MVIIIRTDIVNADTANIFFKKLSLITNDNIILIIMMIMEMPGAINKPNVGTSCPMPTASP